LAHHLSQPEKPVMRSHPFTFEYELNIAETHGKSGDRPQYGVAALLNGGERLDYVKIQR
jgi:hypothetical protein